MHDGCRLSCDMSGYGPWYSKVSDELVSLDHSFSLTRSCATLVWVGSCGRHPSTMFPKGLENGVLG